MSGGVDSSVTAMLLQREGWDVTGMFMKNWDDDDGSSHCTAAADLIQAAAVADRLGIPLQTVSFSKDYRERVFAPFLEQLRAGLTPNPDVLCNREIKFEVFIDHARELGADHVATGHYARLKHCDDGSIQLLAATDETKDQSYFLHAVPQRRLHKVLFPLGELPKTRVRDLAREAGLPNHDRKDSTGICFIGERPLPEFLRRYLPEQEGDIVTPDGAVLGRHQGLDCYTIGQRRGLGLGGMDGRPGLPWYVAAKDPAHNRLIVVQGGEHPALFGPGLNTRTPHWIGGQQPLLPLHCKARIRHLQPLQSCVVSARQDAEGLQLNFDRPQRAITPGQCAVLYLDSVCLGGAVIDNAESDQSPAEQVPMAS